MSKGSTAMFNFIQWVGAHYAFQHLMDNKHYYSLLLMAAEEITIYLVEEKPRLLILFQTYPNEYVISQQLAA